MLRIVPIQPVGIAKDCGRFLKRDAMFLEVGNGLRNIPRKRIHVYTLIRPRPQGRWGAWERTLDNIATPCSVKA